MQNNNLFNILAGHNLVKYYIVIGLVGRKCWAIKIRKTAREICIQTIISMRVYVKCSPNQ